MAEEVTDAIDVALLVARAIESVGGAYFVGGSVASSFQGEPRATNDIDIVLDLPLGRIDALVGALGPSFEVDVDMLRDALLHGRTCNIFFLPLLTKVDLFALGPSPFDQIEFSRRKPVAVREWPLDSVSVIFSLARMRMRRRTAEAAWSVRHAAARWIMQATARMRVAGVALRSTSRKMASRRASS
jgi:hypothetical protein